MILQIYVVNSFYRIISLIHTSFSSSSCPLLVRAANNMVLSARWIFDMGDAANAYGADVYVTSLSLAKTGYV
jgi:hypothetical protein